VDYEVNQVLRAPVRSQQVLQVNICVCNSRTTHVVHRSTVMVSGYDCYQEFVESLGVVLSLWLFKVTDFWFLVFVFYSFLSCAWFR